MGRRSNPSVSSRCDSLLLSLPADVRSTDDVIAFAGQSAPLVAIAWGVLYYKEFKGW